MRARPARPETAQVKNAQVKVWDPFVRAFHWTTVSLVGINFLTPQSGTRSIHVAIGYAVLGLVAARVLWGLVGTRHARFANFVRHPRTVLTYLRQLRQGRAPRHLGHNPAGAAMIVLLLLTLLGIGTTGWLSQTNAYYGVSWVMDVHAFLAYGLLWLVGLHVAGVLLSSLMHRENLVRAMFTGRKPLVSAAGHRPADLQREDGAAAASFGHAD